MLDGESMIDGRNAHADSWSEDVQPNSADNEPDAGHVSGGGVCDQPDR